MREKLQVRVLATRDFTDPRHAPSAPKLAADKMDSSPAGGAPLGAALDPDQPHLHHHRGLKNEAHARGEPGCQALALVHPVGAVLTPSRLPAWGLAGLLSHSLCGIFAALVPLNLLVFSAVLAGPGVFRPAGMQHVTESTIR